jgi:ClpP class serine protease
MEMQGGKMEVIKAGKFKGIGIQGTSLSDDQRGLLQAEVEQIHEMFKGAVRIGRGNLGDDLMQGQDFMGADAVKLGLADTLGNMDEAIALIHLIQERSK